MLTFVNANVHERINRKRNVILRFIHCKAMLHGLYNASLILRRLIIQLTSVRRKSYVYSRGQK